MGGRSVGVRSGRALCTRMTLERVSMHVFWLSLTAMMEEGNNSLQIMDWCYRFVGEYVQRSFRARPWTSALPLGMALGFL